MTCQNDPHSCFSHQWSVLLKKQSTNFETMYSTPQACRYHWSIIKRSCDLHWCILLRLIYDDLCEEWDIKSISVVGHSQLFLVRFVTCPELLFMAFNDLWIVIKWYFLLWNSTQLIQAMWYERRPQPLSVCVSVGLPFQPSHTFYPIPVLWYWILPTICTVHLGLIERCFTVFLTCRDFQPK